VILNKTLMPFATSGCTIESPDGKTRWRIVGRDHVGHAGTDLVVCGADGAKPAAAALEQAFGGGRAFTVHGYGPGDRFEVATHFYRDQNRHHPRTV